MIGGWALLLLVLAGVSALPFAVRWYNVQALSAAIRCPPAGTPRVGFDVYERHEARAGASKPPAGARVAHRLTGWFGYDALGRSLFYRVQAATLVSLAIGLAAAGVAVIVGTLWGAVSALVGGRVDLVMMRVVDLLYGLPYVLMVILLRTALARPLDWLFGRNAVAGNLALLFLAIGGVSWLTVARVVRGQVLSLRTRGFVDAARAAGAGRWHVLRWHILPNLVGPVVVCATMVVPQAVLQESFLSFLGIGIRPPMPSLGRLAADGVEAVNAFVSYWWLLAFPCGVLVVMLLALTLIGDGIRDALDPKSRAAPIV
ncbi:MAG: ABC transporter permease [Phycisphaerae bacterium]